MEGTNKPSADKVASVLDFYGIKSIKTYDMNESCVPQSYYSHFGWHFKTYNVPLEYVVTENTICYSLQGRYCELGLIINPSGAVTPLHSCPIYGSVNTAIKEDAWLYLVEIFEDYGNDGHVEYRLIGHAVLTPTQLEKYLNIFKKKG